MHNVDLIILYQIRIAGVYIVQFNFFPYLFHIIVFWIIYTPEDLLNMAKPVSR